jgi:N-acetyl-alpha-D-glucosaminyl L-malate synthase BshA
MRIGIVCYASVGGSGVVATELAKSLARRGHEIHVVSTEAPFRLREFQTGLSFHRVETPSYPLLREPQFMLSLANRLVQLSREERLEILHAHYAVPHATAAYLARAILASSGDSVPRLVTTLHGTDITLLGSDSAYSEAVGFSIDQSDGVTAVSESLKADTYRALRVRREITVIPNYLDCGTYDRREVAELRDRLTGGSSEKVVVHMSNFRPVKRADAVIEVFVRLHARLPARLLLVGEGPDLDGALRLARELGVADAVTALGEQDDVVSLLSVADLFLLPSVQESFGLAALEAMACGVPVVASRVGGLPEVVADGECGFLHPPDDLGGMADSAVRILGDPELHERMARAGRRLVCTRFSEAKVVPRYEAFYETILRNPAPVP